MKIPITIPMKISHHNKNLIKNHAKRGSTKFLKSEKKKKRKLNEYPYIVRRLKMLEKNGDEKRKKQEQTGRK